MNLNGQLLGECAATKYLNAGKLLCRKLKALGAEGIDIDGRAVIELLEGIEVYDIVIVQSKILLTRRKSDLRNTSI